MPTKSLTGGKLFIMNDNGEYQEIANTIEEHEFYPENITGKDVGRIWEPKEFTVEIPMPKGLTYDDLFLIFVLKFSYNQVICNNWRKLHGLPMKRRIIK